MRRGGRVAEGGGLLNRYRALKPYRGFESPSLRQYLPAHLGLELNRINGSTLSSHTEDESRPELLGLIRSCCARLRLAERIVVSTGVATLRTRSDATRYAMSAGRRGAQTCRRVSAS